MPITRYIAYQLEARAGRRWLPEGVIPSALFEIYHPDQVIGAQFLHIRRVLRLDRGHDWNIHQGQVRLAEDRRWVVARFGPQPSCCDQELVQGSKFCPCCGQPTTVSIVEEAP